MFKDSHSHLFDIAGSKDSCGNNSPCALSGPDDPRLYGPTRDKNNRSKAEEIFWCFRRAVSREVLRSGDENDCRLGEFPGDEVGVREITRMDGQIEAVFNNSCRA